MKTKFNFTKTNILNIKPPAKGFLTFHDTEERGLKLYITPKGTKSFFVRKLINGRDERIVLGSFPEMTVQKAREEALKVKRDFLDGINPNLEKQKLSKEMSLKQYFDGYIENIIISKSNNEKTIKEKQSLFNRFLAKLGNKKVSSINNLEIRKLIQSIKSQKGIYIANDIIKLTRHIFNKAIEDGVTTENPSMGIKKDYEPPRERFLQENELAKFFKALKEEPNRVIADFIMMCLLTGARRSNVASMRWEDINLEQQVWYIKKTKNGTSQRAVLSNKAIECLKQIKSKSNSNEWVFPSDTSKSGHIIDPKKGWKRVLERADIKDLRIHDLRRTFGSYQAMNGSNSFIIGNSLNHSSIESTAIYARTNTKAILASVETATDYIFNVAENSESENLAK